MTSELNGDRKSSAGSGVLETVCSAENRNDSKVAGRRISPFRDAIHSEDDKMSTELTDSDRLKRIQEITFDLHEAGVAMMKLNLQGRHADATEAERREMLRAWLQDTSLPGAICRS